VQSPFVLDHRQLRARHVASPWTGNLIPLDALLDACFVWSGIWHLWRRSGDREAAGLCKRAGSGFRADPLILSFQPVADLLADDVLSAIESVQESVLAMAAR
jgi:hypothetical protein